MYTVTPALYEQTATRLRKAIGRNNYYSGSLDFTFDDIDCRFTASLIVYRQQTSMPDDTITTIDDIVPVWWQFSTSREGIDLLNDFSFGELRDFIL